MNRVIHCLIAMGITGCGEDESSASDQDQSQECDVVVEGTWPSDGSTEAYYRDSVEFYLSDADRYAKVIADFSGVQSFEDDGRTVVYEPDEPLSPSTDYSVALDYCFGQPSIEFATSSLGLPLSDPESLVGATFLLDPTDGRFTDEGRVGEVLAGLYGRSLLVQFIDYDEGIVDVRLAVAEQHPGNPTQDECYRTLDLSSVRFANDADFLYEEEQVEFAFYGATMSFFDVETGGTVAPDVQSLGGARFHALVEIDSLALSLGFESREDICNLAEQLGQSCVECPSDSGTLCLDIAADRLKASRVDLDLALVQERNDLPECNEGDTGDPSL